MKDPNIFNKNIPQNPFQQIQGNIQLFQPNSPGFYPLEENNPFQKKDEPEKDKNENELI